MTKTTKFNVVKIWGGTDSSDRTHTVLNKTNKFAIIKYAYVNPHGLYVTKKLTL